MTERDERRNAVECPCLVVGEGRAREDVVEMIREASVELALNGRVLDTARCMEADLGDLAVGHLVSSGLLRARDELVGVEILGDGARVDVRARIPDERRRLGRYEGRPVSSSLRLDATDILRIGREFNEREGLYARTRCVHSAALWDGRDIVCFREDVGRHNALDKAIGAAFLAGLDFSSLMALSSGRFPADMVSKLAGAGIPLVVTPGVATVEGASLAEDCRIAVCGRLRSDGFIVYSGRDRVSTPRRP